MTPALPDDFELAVLSDFVHRNGGAAAVAIQTARRFLAHNRAGLHFRGGSVDSLAERLARLRDADRATRLGQGTDDCYWQSPWTPSAHTDALRRICAHTLAAATRRPSR